MDECEITVLVESFINGVIDVIDDAVGDEPLEGDEVDGVCEQIRYKLNEFYGNN